MRKLDMSHSKICPICFTPNYFTSIICARCFQDISIITPVDDNKIQDIINKGLPSEDLEGPVMILKTQNNQRLAIRNGAILGRKGVGSHIFEKIKTVSRSHIRISRDIDKWYVEDLNSFNGTYLNKEKIDSRKKIEIKLNDQISISKEMQLKVEKIDLP